MTDKTNPFRVCLGCGERFEINPIEAHQRGCAKFRKDDNSKEGWQTMGDLGVDYSYWMTSRRFDWPPERYFLVVQMRELTEGQTECRWKNPRNGKVGPVTTDYGEMLKTAREYLAKTHHLWEDGK